MKLNSLTTNHQYIPKQPAACAVGCSFGGEDEIGSHSLSPSRSAPAGALHNVKETAPGGVPHFSPAPNNKQACMGANKKRLRPYLVTTVSFTLCGEDEKILEIPSIYRWFHYQPFTIFGLVKFFIPPSITRLWILLLFKHLYHLF